MPRVHRVEEIERLTSTNLSNDDAVGRHSKRLMDEHLDRDCSTPFGVWRPALQRDAVVELAPQVQLGLVLDGYHTFVRADEAGKHSHESRLACAGPSGDEDVQPPGDGRLQK